MNIHIHPNSTACSTNALERQEIKMKINDTEVKTTKETVIMQNNIDAFLMNFYQTIFRQHLCLI